MPFRYAALRWAEGCGRRNTSRAQMSNTILKRPTFCHVCGYDTDAANSLVEGPGRQLPAPGDLSVCLNCGTLAILAPDMALRAPKPEDCGNLPEAALVAQFAVRQRGRLAP
jgi:hypothetical protein